MTGEGTFEPDPTQQDLAMKELLLPNEYEFPWLTAIRKTSLETLFFNRYTAVSRWGKPRADPGPDLPPQEKSDAGLIEWRN